MGTLGDDFKKRAMLEEPAPVEYDAEEEKRRYAVSSSLGDHYRDRQRRLEDAAKRATKSDVKPRTSDGIIGTRG